MWIPQCAQCFLHFWRYNNIPWKPVCHWDFDILMWLLPSWCDFLPTRCYMGLMWLLPNWCDLNPSLVAQRSFVWCSGRRRASNGEAGAEFCGSGPATESGNCQRFRALAEWHRPAKPMMWDDFFWGLPCPTLTFRTVEGNVWWVCQFPVIFSAKLVPVVGV